MKCNDRNCPYHGNVRVRGQILKGTVISTKQPGLAIVERELIQYIPKYERYMRKRSRIHAHNPPCINAKINDVVEIGETRRISKTKGFVITKILKQYKGE